MEPQGPVQSGHIELTGNINFLRDANRRRKAHLDKMAEDLLENNILQVRAALSLNDKTVMPYGHPNFTADEREKMICRISKLVLSKKRSPIGPGCSILLDVLAEAIDELYAKLRSPRNKLSKQLLNLKGVKRKITRQQLLATYMGNVKGLLGLTSGAVKQLGNYHLSLAWSKENNLKLCQKVFVKIRASMAETEKLIDFESIGGKALFDSVRLLEDMVTQQMHRLAHPLNETPNLSQHFTRLEQRAIRHKQFVENWDDQFFPDHQLHKKQPYRDLGIKQNQITIELCNYLIPLFGELKKNGENHRQHLKTLWLKLSECMRKFRKQGESGGLLRQLSIDSTDSSDKQLHLLKYLAQWVINSNQTLMNEAWLVLLKELILASDVSVEEMDTCIKNLTVVAVMIGDQELESLQERVDALKGEGAAVAAIRDIWRIHIKPVYLSVLRHFAEQMKIRLKRCQKRPGDMVERALFLRDAVAHLGRTLIFFTEYVETTMTEAKTFLVHKEPFSPEVEDLWQSFVELNSMQGQAALAAIEGIKALIGRCFVQMDSNGEELMTAKQLEIGVRRMAANRAAEKLTNLDNVKNPRKKRKRRKKRKNPFEPSDKKNDNKQSNPVVTSAAPPQNAKKNKKKKSALAGIPTTHATLTMLTQHLNEIQKQERPCSAWQKAQKKNLCILVERLEESFQKKSFSSDAIFDENDLAWRAIEAALEIAMDETTDLDDVQAQGHNLDRLLTILLHSGVSDNIKEVAWYLRRIPLTLAKGNFCVNYFCKALELRKRLTNSARQLVDRLNDVKTSSEEKQQENLFKKHRRSMRKILYFIERLLAAVCDPQLTIGEGIPDDVKQVLELEGFSAAVATAKSKPVSSYNVPEQDNQMEIAAIETRKEALRALERALAWSSIRKVSPVEGTRRVRERKTNRNISLNNVAHYLGRLKEKLGTMRFNSPMNTVFGEWDLTHRALKELILAALYHSDTMENGRHIVDARNIPLANNPCFLKRVLEEISTCPTQLPHPDDCWQHAHKVLSHPFPLKSVEGPKHPLSTLIEKARVISREHIRSIKGGELVLASGKTKSANERLNERMMLVKTNEKEYIFPALTFLLHTLREGFSIPIHNDLLASAP